VSDRFAGLVQGGDTETWPQLPEQPRCHVGASASSPHELYIFRESNTSPAFGDMLARKRIARQCGKV
jgi:hypothetical protein